MFDFMMNTLYICGAIVIMSITAVFVVLLIRSVIKSWEEVTVGDINVHGGDYDAKEVMTAINRQVRTGCQYDFTPKSEDKDASGS